MSWLKSLWTDESGSVLTAEAVLLGTMGVAGATVGMNMASNSVKEELKDVSRSMRPLDQSYEIAGFTGCRARTAGSNFRQTPVKKSIQRLDKLEKNLDAEYRRSQAQEKERLQELRDQLRRDADLQRKRAEEAERKRLNRTDEDD